jgi:hypothetical protein
MMKRLSLLLVVGSLILSAVAWSADTGTAPHTRDRTEEDELGGWGAAEPEQELEENLDALEDDLPLDPNNPPVTWVDHGHAVMTNQAQALTEWMDAFFGDPNYNLEQAESFLRLEAFSEWDEEDGVDLKLRLRGKVQLPKISKRLNLFFAGEEGDTLTEEERNQEDQIGIQYRVREGTRSRFDATIGWASGSLRPGIRYRNEGVIDERNSYRYIQRLQYEDGENFFTTGQVDLNHILDDDNILRWSNRAKWGDHTDGVEWRTRLSLRQARDRDARRPVALNYYGTINGVTRPDSFVKNYRLGVIWRRQVYRDFLFLEVEPAFNYRRRKLEDEREPAWSLILRLEIALERDLRRVRQSD